MRLDHLLSKEHHEKSEALGLARAVRSWWPVVGAGLVRNNESSFLQRHETADTLLGPEATPLGLKRFGWALSLHLGGGVWCLFIG